MRRKLAAEVRSPQKGEEGGRLGGRQVGRRGGAQQGLSSESRAAPGPPLQGDPLRPRGRAGTGEAKPLEESPDGENSGGRGRLRPCFV